VFAVPKNFRLPSPSCQLRCPALGINGDDLLLKVITADWIHQYEDGEQHQGSLPHFLRFSAATISDLNKIKFGNEYPDNIGLISLFQATVSFLKSK
jgi:hypothetical protein